MRFVFSKFYLFISSGDHTEVISIDYDPTRISYEQLLDLFWNNHEYGLTKRIKRQVSKLSFTSLMILNEICFSFDCSTCH